MGIFNIRTDLALENGDFSQKVGLLSGLKVIEKKYNNISVIRLDVLNQLGESAVGKPAGTYITIEAGNMCSNDDAIHENISIVLGREIKELIINEYHWKSKVPEILVAGLGNPEATPDSLGPRVVANLEISNPFSKIPDRAFAVIRAISPGVMAQTGMETSEILRAIIKETEPDILLVIDSLAARSFKRLNTTIQLSNTGIIPGSGVFNDRTAINKKNMGIPVIAVGIPMVVDAATLIHDAIKNERFDYEKYQKMYVTSKDVDALVKRTSFTVSEAINKCAGNLL